MSTHPQDEYRSIFIEAVRASSSLPSDVQDLANSVRSCERSIFDQDYLGFLQRQIDLEPRGPEWTAVLARRLSALSPFRDLPTISGVISTPAGDCHIRVDPNHRQVIHHELHESASGG